MSREARTTLLNRFVHAIMARDRNAMMQLLAADVTWTSDGGGRTRAALKPIHGDLHVARFVLNAFKRKLDAGEFRPLTVNDEPGLAYYIRGRLVSVIAIQTDGSRILDIFCTLNPEKLNLIAGT